MSSLDSAATERITDALAHAVRRLREVEGLRIEQTVSVGWSAPFSPGSVELHVHGCEPHELDAYRTRWDGCTEHFDSDAILRWIEVDLDGVQATFYRR